MSEAENEHGPISRDMFAAYPVINNDMGELHTILFCRPGHIPIMAGMYGRATKFPHVPWWKQMFIRLPDTPPLVVYTRDLAVGALNRVATVDTPEEAIDIIINKFKITDIEKTLREHPDPPIYL